MSLSVDMTVKNYRCINDSNPLKIKISDGFTSFVGRNNSGKSSILKLFFEFRALWVNFSDVNNHANSISHRQIGINHMRGIDPLALFFSENDRNLSIKFDFNLPEPVDGEAERYISTIRIEISRESPTLCNINYYDNNGSLLEGSVNSHISYSVPNRLEPIIASSTGDRINVSALVKFFPILRDALYIGPFRNAINQGEGNYYDVQVGATFIQQWNSWKNGNLRKQNYAIATVISDIRNIFEFSNIDINASSDNQTLKLNVNDRPYEMDDLGAGLAQFIIVLGNAAIKKPSIILIDEPELHLHPTLQIDFMTSLAKYSTNGVMFATHSLGLARVVSDSIYSCQLKNSCSEVTLYEKTPNYIEFLGEMSFAAYKEMGFESILLVEGVSDVKTIQQFLRKLKKDPLLSRRLSNVAPEFVDI